MLFYLLFFNETGPFYVCGSAAFTWLMIFLKILSGLGAVSLTLLLGYSSASLSLLLLSEFCPSSLILFLLSELSPATFVL